MVQEPWSWQVPTVHEVPRRQKRVSWGRLKQLSRTSTALPGSFETKTKIGTSKGRQNVAADCQFKYAGATSGEALRFCAVGARN